jgi:hypothetical protein
MQVRIFLHFLFITFYILISTQVVEAQRVEINKEGEKIVLFPDGKWEYFDKTNPTHIVIDEANKSSQIAAPNDIFDEQTSKGENEEKRYENLLSDAKDKLALALERESDVKFSKILLEEEIEDLKRSGEDTKEKIDALKRQLKLIKALGKDAKKETKKAKKEFEKLKKQGKIVQKPTKKKSRKIQKLKSAEKELQASKYMHREDGNFFTASKKFEKYSIEKDVMYNPPREDCKLAFDGVDEFMGKKRKDVERSVFFTYTNDDMRRYMKDDDYITCEGNLTQIKGGVLLLNLFISINTTDAQRSFGGLSKGNLVVVKMINGESVNLVNNQSDIGVFNPLKKQHTYTGQFRINAGQENAFKKGEVDLIIIILDAVFEYY